MKSKLLPFFQVENCSGCRACVSVCLSDSLEIVDEMILFKNPENCLSEGRCVDACPMNGIRMQWTSLQNLSNLRPAAI